MNSSTTATEARAKTGTRRGGSLRAVALSASFGVAALLGAAVVAVGLSGGPAHAQDVVITSEQKGAEVLPLGLVAFTRRAEAPRSPERDPADVIASDLDLSGRFRMRRAPTFTKGAKVLFGEDGALGYVRGEYALEGDRYTLQAELVDLGTGEVILRRRFGGPRDEFARAAHRFSDELVYQLFGEKGIAQTRLAFVHRGGGAKEIWAMDYDGADAGAVTRNGSINLSPVFAGGRDQLIFSSYLHGRPQFYWVDPDHPSPRPAFSSPGMNSAPAYNRVDREIAYASTGDGNSEIYRRPAAGGKAERLTFSSSIETSPAWSPNGQEIAFVSDRSGRPMLYVMDRDGSNTRRITYDFAYVGTPSWSPKGDRIAFAAMDDGNNFNIYTTAPDGSEPVRLTTGGSNENPTWSPDGRFIAFSSTRGGSADIYVMRADGQDMRRLTFTGGNTMPSWSDY
jgi:TolB protein